jgi:hypothetical protein
MPAFYNILLNGTAYTPSGITVNVEKIGMLIKNARGGRTFVQRTTSGGAPIVKHIWELEWDGATETIRNQLMVIGKLSTTFTLRDPEGNSWTVQTEADSYSDSWMFQSAAGVMYYRVSLKLYEA